MLDEGTQVEMQLDFNSTSSPTSSQTPRRTDGRTNEEVLAAVDQVSVADARRERDEFATIGEVIADGILPTGERHHIERSGDRAEIPIYVRSAVWHRDRGRCELCGWLPVHGPWHLDHITPWSAGGSDRTDNLRVLCEKHNLQRSNYVDPTERPRRSATWWCLGCMSEPWPMARRLLDGVQRVVCPSHGWSMACTVQRALRWIEENDAEDWWSRKPIDPDGPLFVAHCAHCNAPGMTDRPL